MLNSLQGRLMLGAGIVLAAGLLISGVIVHAATRASMESEFDRALIARVRSLTMMVEDTEKGIDVEFGEEDFAEFTADESPDYFQVWHADGSTLAKSSTLGDRNLDTIAVSPPESCQDVQMKNEPTRRQYVVQWHPIADIDAEDNERELAGPRDAEHGNSDSGEDDLETASDVLLTIAVARSTAAIENQLTRLAWLIALVGTSATVLSMAGLFWVIRRTLQPVRAIAHSLQEMDETRLDQPIAPDRMPVELAPMVGRLNELLGRLETAFHRERDFSHNVAHELRTPLAGLKSTLEVHLARLHEPAEYEDALNSCLSISDQMTNMVESLLALSRAEKNENTVEKQTVRLDRVLDECWEPLATRSAEKGLDATWSVAPIELETDKEKLRVILRNVLTNAVSHSNENGVLRISTAAENGSVHIKVANSGNRIRNGEMDRVFDRFWRGDSSRDGTGEHFGLGLTLVKSMTELLGGTIAVDGADRQFQVAVTFPRADG